MLQQQFIEIVRSPQHIAQTQLTELEMLVKEYPFFETAHLLYTKGLHQTNALNYSRQLRKTAIVANSRAVLYELLHQKELQAVASIVEPPVKEEVKTTAIVEPELPELPQNTNPVTITNSDIKVIYVSTVPEKPVMPVVPVIPEKEIPVVMEEARKELDIIKDIENETETPVQEFNEQKLNKDIEAEISRGIIQSYVETDIIKTPELHTEEPAEPGSFTDWLHRIKKEAGTIQVPEVKKEEKSPEDVPKIDKKSSFFEQNKGIIDKIIESDPGRIKLGTGKFFTPAIDAKQSLRENEHLVTETLAKIYALQGNISKAIRAYEILSLKFPQKSVYFASLIEKLKTTK